MSDHWDTEKFPCPHCLIKALVEGALEFGIEPKELVTLIIAGLREGLNDCDGVTIMTNKDMPSVNDIMH